MNRPVLPISSLSIKLPKADRSIEIDMMSMPANPKAIERVAEAGCRRAIRWLPSGDRNMVERALEGWEAAIAKHTGEV